MQFKEQQREQVKQNWGPGSWFYNNLGQPARAIVGRAYGLIDCSPREQSVSQEYLTLALSIFARKIGADKSHAVHALLTNSPSSLMAAICKKEGSHVSTDSLAEAWQDAFRQTAHLG